MNGIRQFILKGLVLSSLTLLFFCQDSPVDPIADVEPIADERIWEATASVFLMNDIGNPQLTTIKIPVL